MSASKNKTGAFLTGALFGGLVGSAVALLYAPKSGEETRKVIADKSIEIRDKAIESGEEIRHRAEEVATETRSRIEETAEVTKGKVSELQDRGQHFLDEQRERIKAAIEAGKQKYEQPDDAIVENGVEKAEPAA